MKLIYQGSLGSGITAKVFIDFKACGSSVDFPNDTESFHIVTIGANYHNWCDVLDGILHEITEMHMMGMELAYQRWYRAGCDCGDVWFHMTHADFSEVISRTASSINCFIDNAQEEFYANKERLIKVYEAKLAKKTKRKKTD